MSNDNGTEFNTPVGRIVWGHPLKPQQKTDKNNQKIIKDGQPVLQWSFGLAIPKAEFLAQVWPHLAAETAKGYPNGVPPTFAYKYKDGDDPNPTWNNGKQGKPLSERPGHAGHYILTISTELQAPSVVRFENGVYREVLPDQIKCGDYVAATLIAKWHAGETPGLYLNPGVIVHAFEGEAIEGGGFSVDPTQSFGAAPQFAMPAGARPLGAPAQPPGLPGAPTVPPTMPGAPVVPPVIAPALPPTTAPLPVSPPAPPSPPAPTGPIRPTDPSHIHLAGQPGEQWFINGAWTPAPVAAAPTLPPPATNFIPGAPGAPTTPGMPPPR